MSQANVQFLTISGSPCPQDETPCRFTFRCVGYNREKCSLNLPDITCAMLLIAGTTSIPRNGQGLNGGRPQWDWNQDRTNPTFTPSINCEAHCGWHGYIREGRCVDASGRDEE